MTVSDLLVHLPYGPAPEAANLAHEWIRQHDGTFGPFIGGQWRTPVETFESRNPATGDLLAHIGQGTGQDVSDAVAAANKAFPEWSALAGTERARYLYAIARQIQKHSRLFSVLESLDNGKPIRESRDLDIPLVSRHFYHHAGWATLRDEQFPDYEPIGVCGQIIPWNFPLLMLAWKIAPALAMGNTVVLKPAEFTSLTALLFAEICVHAGLPAGVVNIVTGDGRTGQALVDSPDVHKIAFTGSTEVGRKIRIATAGSGKKLSLELGGKSPFIVFDDADLDGAVEGLVDAIWFNQGQVCCAGSRLLVQESVADRLIAKVKTRMASLRVGDSLDKAIDVGAIVDQVQLDRIDKLVRQGVDEGADMFQIKDSCPRSGCFYPPTLLTNVHPASTVAQEEIFGPVLVCMTFRTPAEAATLANNTPYGLASSVWSENLNTALDLSTKIHAGTVWINCSNQFDGAVGFGGYKESGFGREGGREGVLEYLKPKNLYGSATFVETPSASAPPASRDGLDRTHKLYIGGKQVRPDGGYSLEYNGFEVSRGNRKDIRNAVEAAEAASGSWAKQTGHGRAQILYYLAENLEAARDAMLNALVSLGREVADAEKEFNHSVDRVLWYAAMADKYEGVVHEAPMRGHVFVRHEPIGVAGVLAPNEAPLLGFLATCLPLWSMGNCVVAVPSEANPLPACELVRLLEASDVPAGTWNVVTGTFAEVGQPLAAHEAVLAVWHFGDEAAIADIERESAHNLKQTWTTVNHKVNWEATPHREFLRRSVQAKNVWVPYGA